jgi:dipeptidyl-peptidase-4
LIVHGTGDDNVHYQNTERLIDALVKAGKRLTMMAYPNRSTRSPRARVPRRTSTT